MIIIEFLEYWKRSSIVPIVEQFLASVKWTTPLGVQALLFLWLIF
jgi:hypothetical protein